MTESSSTAVSAAETAATLISKVLVLDTDAGAQALVGAFCQRHHLQAHKVRRDNVLSVLASVVDLGGIFLSDQMGDDAAAGRELGQHIHALRPDLPLFLRCENETDRETLSPAQQRCFSAVYTAENIESLEPVIGTAIFSLVYPGALVRGLMDITRASFASQFRHLQLEIDPPYVVRDRLIFGEIFTLIPIESRWCRGFMMLQSEEEALKRLVEASHTHIDSDEAEDFRNLNSLLSELTNLIWGAFKNRYGDHHAAVDAMSQVPIVVNNLHRYISFGSSDPQLGLRCTLTSLEDPSLPPVVIYQRFVFNLNWSPEDFSENGSATDNLLATGELELF